VNERDLLGFNVFRADAKGRLARVNRTLIRARRSGLAGGAVYRVADRSAQRSTGAGYRLQTVGLDSAKSWYGSGVAPTR
jgi:hypothetical protein